MPNADLAAQRALLKLADTDRQTDAARHQRGALPEIAAIAEGSARAAELRDKVVLGEAELSDIDGAARKLDDEIASVRARSDRDQERLASGAVSPKEMESLQREVESLARRQAALEDDALELMERRENADAALSGIRTEFDSLSRDVDAATVRRNDLWADLDAELDRLAVQRASVAPQIPADVMAVYDRLRAAGKIAAAPMVGEQCGGCGMALDRASLEEIRAAAADVVPRCPECSALLVRNP